MQINRLLEIVYILLDKKTVTARELSEHFEVSKRTIYRDIEILSGAGIPVYTNKGKGGGIGLLDNFVLNKSMLSNKEQIDILSSLQGLSALNVPDIEPILKKLSAAFDKNNTSWIDVDFSHWGSNDIERKKFSLLRTAILNGNVLAFDYMNASGEETKRTVEPLKILFKEQSWYVNAFCRAKSDFRIFKITRMKNLNILNEIFKRDIPKDMSSDFQGFNGSIIKLALKIEAKMAYRVYDEFDQAFILKNEDGSFIVTVAYPENEWLYGYVLSYGDDAEVLEPKHFRDTIKRKLEDSLKKYL
jgi:predicted DNA-binding transcriptional regulator YafY